MIVYTYLNKMDAHSTDSDPLKTTTIYNAFDNETGISKRIDILATTGDAEAAEEETDEAKAQAKEQAIHIALEAAYN